jgi:hypothetical protein
MREIQASEAKTHLPQLLDEIERGDENHPEAVTALDRLKDDEAFAPSLLWFELRILLLANERLRSFFLRFRHEMPKPVIVRGRG